MLTMEAVLRDWWTAAELPVGVQNLAKLPLPTGRDFARAMRVASASCSRAFAGRLTDKFLTRDRSPRFVTRESATADILALNESNRLKMRKQERQVRCQLQQAGRLLRQAANNYSVDRQAAQLLRERSDVLRGEGLVTIPSAALDAYRQLTASEDTNTCHLDRRLQAWRRAATNDVVVSDVLSPMRVFVHRRALVVAAKDSGFCTLHRFAFRYGQVHVWQSHPPGGWVGGGQADVADFALRWKGSTFGSPLKQMVLMCSPDWIKSFDLLLVLEGDAREELT